MLVTEPISALAWVALVYLVRETDVNAGTIFEQSSLIRLSVARLSRVRRPGTATFGWWKFTQMLRYVPITHVKNEMHWVWLSHVHMRLWSKTPETNLSGFGQGGIPVLAKRALVEVWALGGRGAGMSKSRLQLTWYKTLIPTEMGKYGYIWVDPADPRYCESTRL